MGQPYLDNNDSSDAADALKERKKLQNRLAQRRHRAKTKELQNQKNSAAVAAAVAKRARVDSYEHRSTAESLLLQDQQLNPDRRSITSSPDDVSPFLGDGSINSVVYPQRESIDLDVGEGFEGWSDLMVALGGTEITPSTTNFSASPSSSGGKINTSSQFSSMSQCQPGKDFITTEAPIGVYPNDLQPTVSNEDHYFNEFAPELSLLQFCESEKPLVKPVDSIEYRQRHNSVPSIPTGEFWRPTIMPAASTNDVFRTPLVPKSTQNMNRMSTGSSPPAIPRQNSMPPKGIRESQRHIEQKLEHILSASQEAGFENFEQLAIAYYTSNLHQSPAQGQAQRLSRARSLQKLLSSLTDGSRILKEGDKTSLRQEILGPAEKVYMSELRRMHLSPEFQIPTDPSELVKYLTMNQWDPTTLRALPQTLRTQLPETWSLFEKIVQRAGVLPQNAVQNICLLILLLHQSEMGGQL